MSRKCEKQKIQSNDRKIQARGYSSLSSTYYSIVGTAFSQFKAALRPIWFAPVRMLVWCFTWLPLSAWCYWRMLPLSDRVVELVGYDGMSADQCDIRQSVLQKRKRYKEADKCIKIALDKNPEKAHTRGLLHAGLAEIYEKKGDWRGAEEEVQAALAEAKEAEKQDSRQAARIYRKCAGITDFFEQGDPIPGNQLRQKAQTIAQATGAQDQLLKL